MKAFRDITCTAEDLVDAWESLTAAAHDYTDNSETGEKLRRAARTYARVADALEKKS